MALDYRFVSAQSLRYQDFLARHATPGQASRQGSHGARALTTAQRSLLQSFRRQMDVLCVADGARQRGTVPDGLGSAHDLHPGPPGDLHPGMGGAVLQWMLAASPRLMQLHGAM